MENTSGEGRFRVSDPRKAAVHLKAAQAELLKALSALTDYQGTKELSVFTKQLGLMADHFEAGRLLAGLKIALGDSVAGARAMGRSTSTKKLKGAETARMVLAAKRAAERKYSIKPNSC